MSEETPKLSFKTSDELTTFLMDLQGQIANMQETIDKLSPVAEETPVEGTEETEGVEGSEGEPTEEEVSEIDKLLQEG